MKYIIYIILLFQFCLPANAQGFLQKLKTIPGQYTSFAVDNLDNIYLTGSTGQLKKLNAAGDSLAVYNDIKKFGEAAYTDVTNPLNILLFYKDFSTIVILDRMLSVKQTLDLRRHNLSRVSAAALAYDGNIWLYDELDNNLKKINERGETVLKTADFRLLFDHPFSPQKIIDRGGYVYLYDSAQCLYKFDYYGALKAKIPVRHWQNISIQNQWVQGYDAAHFYRYDTNTLMENTILNIFTEKNYSGYLQQGEKIYALRNDGLDVFLTTAETQYPQALQPN